jgi:acid phosphatase family membrane protein YuiD
MNAEKKVTGLDKQFGIVVMIDALGVSQYTLDQCVDFVNKQNNIREDLEQQKNSFNQYNFFK